MCTRLTYMECSSGLQDSHRRMKRAKESPSLILEFWIRGILAPAVRIAGNHIT